MTCVCARARVVCSQSVQCSGHDETWDERADWKMALGIYKLYSVLLLAYPRLSLSLSLCVCVCVSPTAACEEKENGTEK
jgi:hypothetical protein